MDSEQQGVDRLRRLWDFTDLSATERRLRAALREETSDSGRAEVLTQLARIEGLHSRFDQANRLLEEAEAVAGASDVARVRLLLERGRVLRVSGDLDAALPLFEEAFETALAAGQDFIAGDAAHMAALAGDMIAWTKRGLELARRSPAAAHWVGTLLNNLGWWHAQRDEQAESLAAYRGSLEAWERHATYPYLREAARVGVARALRALGRPEEAIPLLEQAVAWAQAAGHPDRAFHEEFAAAYADLGRAEEAAEQERLSALAGPGQFALWQSRPRPPRSDPGLIDDAAMPETASDPVARQVDAYNRRDIDAFLSCYAPDTVIEDAAGSAVMRGQDAMRTAYGELFIASPNLHAEIATRIRIGAYVIDEERISGRRDSADEVRVVAIYHVAGDLIDHVRLIR